MVLRDPARLDATSRLKPEPAKPIPTYEQSGPDEANGWRRTLWVMVAVQILMQAGFTLSNSLLPLFLERDLGLAQGRSLEMWAGIVASGSFLTTAIFSPVWGNLADRYGRKIMVLRSTAAVAVFSLVAVFVVSPLQMFGARVAMGCLSGFAATAVALVASVTPPERLGYALGMLGSGQVLGNVTGPLLGGLISSAFGYRVTFGFTAVLSAAAFVLTLVAARETFVRPPLGGRGAAPGTAPGAAPKAARRPVNLLSGLMSLARAPDLAPMFVVLLLTTLAISGIGPVLAIFVGDLKVSEAMIPTVAGLAFSAAGLGEAIAAPFMGRAADRVGYRRILVTCLAGAALVFIPHALVRTPAQLIALRFGLGLFTGGIIPTASALLGRLAPPGHQSAVYGLTFSATSMGNFFGPLLGGFVAGTLGLRAVFLTTAGLIALNTVWVWARVRSRAATASAAAAGTTAANGQPGVGLGR